MVTVRKPDGTAHICIDFKRINAVTTPLPFYMPRVEEVLEQVGRSRVLSKLDLSKGYYQVPMAPGNIEKTSFVCHRGNPRMPFGVRNAPAMLQALMTHLFAKCKEFCSPYMDDLVIFSDNWAEHRQPIRAVMQCLREKLDLSKGYYQVPMAPGNIEKTSLVCHRGNLRMPFGVRNAPAVFQALMTRLFAKCKEFCSPYMDDLVIFSDNWAENRQPVRAVMQCLKEAGLTANQAKCHWGGTRMEYLGHLVGEGTITIPDYRVKSLASYSKPVTKKGLRSFLGAISFYRRYVDLLAKDTAVLSPSTAKLAPSKVLWTGELESAFTNICKCIIANTCELTIPLPEDMMSVVTDALGLGIGGVLQLQRDGRWDYSRQIRVPEQRYSATELEVLALVETVCRFGYYLYGKWFLAPAPLSATDVRLT